MSKPKSNRKGLRAIEYAPHAQLRMNQRSIAPGQVWDALLRPDEDIEGDRPGRRVAIKRVQNGRELVVVYVVKRKRANVITTYWRKPWK